MKRFLIVAVAGVFGAALLIACGGDAKKPAETGGTTAPGATTSAAPAMDSAAPSTSAS